ncbi:E2F transcription factor-like E2FF [Camellia sinensis]|uniref:E2F transcription factor-like E2FF n=1 Tax=Camellia sinensis TaxID=4442 RepID=UPI001036A753|nr:E2F transcription factor-like E2FF [Camellia sinensis]
MVPSQNGVRCLMLDMYDFHNDIRLCHSFGGICFNNTSFVYIGHFRILLFSIYLLAITLEVDNRKEKSLGLLTQNFVKLFLCSNVDLISLEEAAKILLDDPSMMRSNDSSLGYLNILLIEGTHHPETRKPAFKWLGTRGKSDNGSANTFVLNESKKRISKKNICKYLVDLISLEEAAKILLGDAHDPSMMRTKVRRLYDIANVLSSMNFIEKTHHPETRKPAFRWLGTI